MEKRPLGRTGISLPVVGFGCGGNAELMVGDDEELRIETIKVALESGIEYFDTAAAYGDGRSEENLGRALRHLGAAPAISTKVVLQVDDLKDLRSAVLSNFDRGLARLGMERVDALMLHNRVFSNPDQTSKFAVGVQLSIGDIFGRAGVAEAFGELLSAGRVGTVGFTAYGGDPPMIAEMISSGVFGALNASFNFLNPSAGVAVPAGFPGADYARVIDTAAAAGLGVMAIQVLARGVLTGAGPDAEPERSVAEVARSYDETLPAVATRYVLAKPGVSTIILGFSEPRHVREAVAAIERGPLSAEAVSSIDKAALDQAVKVATVRVARREGSARC